MTTTETDLAAVPAEERERIRTQARAEARRSVQIVGVSNGTRDRIYEDIIRREVAAWHAAQGAPEFQPGYHHPDPATDQEVRLDLAEGRAIDAAAGIREGWHRGCCEWHHTGGRAASLCNTIAHRGTTTIPETLTRAEAEERLRAYVLDVEARGRFLDNPQRYIPTAPEEIAAILRAYVRHLNRLAAASPEQIAKDHAVGLYRKFDVRRTDGSSAPGGKHEACEYFVLDWQHDPFTVPAVRAYADACEQTYPALAADLRAKAAALAPTAIVEQTTRATSRPAERVSKEELSVLLSAEIEDTGYRLSAIEPGDRDHVPRAVMVKPGSHTIKTALFRHDSVPLLDLARRLAAEVRALQAERDAQYAEGFRAGLAAQPAPLPAEVREAMVVAEHVIATPAAEGAPIPWNVAVDIAKALCAEGDITQQAATVMRIASRRAEQAARPHADGAAMDTELARAVRDTLGETTHDGVIERLEELLDVEKESAARPARAADATEEARRESPIELLAREFDRAAHMQGRGLIDHDRGDCYRDAAKRMRAVDRPGLTEEQAGDVRSIRRSLGLTQEALGGKIGYRGETISRWENGHEKVPPVVRLALIGLRASSGETGPDDQAVCMAAAAKAGWTFDPATGRWSGPARPDDDIDSHPRHRAGNCNDCGAPATKGSDSMGQFCDRCAPAELPDLEVRSPTDSTAELARVLAHVATLPVWCAPTPPDGMRPAALGGECARCLAQPGYHEESCVRRQARGLTEEQARAEAETIGDMVEAHGLDISIIAAALLRASRGEVPPASPLDVSIPRTVLAALVKATQYDPDVRPERQIARRALQQAVLAAEPVRTDPEAARAAARANDPRPCPECHMSVTHKLGCSRRRGGQ